MANEEYRRVLVWGGWLRLSHLCVGIATLVLLSTGWLIAGDPLLAEAALDYHYLAASLLLFGLILRLALMIFGQGNERLGGLMPLHSELRGMGQTLLFYLSLARAPLPRSQSALEAGLSCGISRISDTDRYRYIDERSAPVLQHLSACNPWILGGCSALVQCSAYRHGGSS